MYKHQRSASKLRNDRAYDIDLLVVVVVFLAMSNCILNSAASFQLRVTLALRLAIVSNQWHVVTKKIHLFSVHKNCDQP